MSQQSRDHKQGRYVEYGNQDGHLTYGKDNPPAAEPLDETLAAGNTTGGTDIEISAGDKIVSPAGANIELEPGAGGDVVLDGDTTVNGKLTVTGLIDPTGVVLDEAPAPSTGVDKGAFFVSDGSGGLSQNEPYYRPESDAPPLLLLTSPSALLYKGTWDADTNTPALSDGGGGGAQGDYYVVNVAGATSIDGISDWEVGDWIVNNGTVWQKIDNTDQVTSVNGQQGAVVLNASDIPNDSGVPGTNVDDALDALNVAAFAAYNRTTGVGYPTVQAAIDAVDTAQEIFLRAGNHVEDLVTAGVAAKNNVKIIGFNAERGYGTNIFGSLTMVGAHRNWEFIGIRVQTNDDTKTALSDSGSQNVVFDRCTFRQDPGVPGSVPVVSLGGYITADDPPKFHNCVIGNDAAADSLEIRADATEPTTVVQFDSCYGLPDITLNGLTGASIWRCDLINEIKHNAGNLFMAYSTCEQITSAAVDAGGGFPLLAVRSSSVRSQTTFAYGIINKTGSCGFVVSETDFNVDGSTLAGADLSPVLGDVVRFYDVRSRGGKVQVMLGGPTGSRPVAPSLYESWFDTTLNTEIWWNGASWVVPTTGVPAGFDTLKNPTGFPNLTDSVISKVDGTLTFTIAPAAVSFDYYYRGNQVTKSGAQNANWTDVEGVHFFYFDAAGALQHTTSETTWVSALLGDGVLVAYLYWDATNKATILFGDERHGFMDPTVHLELHQVFGARWNSGGALGAFTIGSGALDSHAEWDCATVSFFDEDLLWQFSDGSPQDLTPILQAPVYYRSGAAGDWRKVAADDHPFIYTGKGGYGGTRVPFNEFTGGAWQLTEVGSNNDFVLTHIFVTNDVNEPVIAIQGQAEYGNLPAAQTGAENELAALEGVLKLFAKEAVPLGTVILQTSSAYANVPKARVVQTAEGGDYVDWRVRFEQGAAGVVSNHGSLSGLSAYDHPQYSSYFDSGSTAYPIIALTAPDHPAAIDDTDLRTPFVTIQAMIDAFSAAGLFGTAAGSWFRPVGVVHSGRYDEDLTIPPDAFLTLCAFGGPVTIGDGALAQFASTTPRSVTWVNDQNVEDAGSHDIGGSQRRPTLVMTGISQDSGEASEFVSAASVCWDISGNFVMASQPGPGTPGDTDVDLHLHGVKVTGSFDQASVDPQYGTLNCYFRRCSFESLWEHGAGHWAILDSCKFDGGAITATYCRVTDCEFSTGSTTLSVGFLETIPPGGFYGCKFNTNIATASAVLMDGVTVEKFSAVIVGGGAIQYMDQASGIGNDSAATGITVKDALDALAGSVAPPPSYAEIYEDNDTGPASTIALTIQNNWYYYKTGSAGEQSGTPWCNIVLDVGTYGNRVDINTAGGGKYKVDLSVQASCDADTTLQAAVIVGVDPGGVTALRIEEYHLNAGEVKSMSVSGILTLVYTNPVRVAFRCTNAAGRNVNIFVYNFNMHRLDT